MNQKKLLKASEKLNAEILNLVRKFHEENPGLEVWTITPFSDKITNVQTLETTVDTYQIKCKIIIATPE